MKTLWPLFVGILSIPASLPWFCSCSTARSLPSDAGTERDTTHDTGTEGEEDTEPGSACPSVQPGNGEACGPEGLACEYGSATVVECDALAHCSGGRWYIDLPTAGDPVCDAGSAAQCPSSMASVPIGQPCSPYELACDYPQGRCACSVRSVLAGPDAAALATWICPSTSVGCPAPRPRLGTACAAHLECDYGTCAIPGADFQTCTNGMWSEQSVNCPGGS